MRWGVVLAVVGATVVAGCGDGSGGLPDAGLLLRDAAPASKSITSAHISMTFSGALPGAPIQAIDADVVARHGSTPGGSVGHVKINGMSIAFLENDGRVFVQGLGGGYQPAPQLPGGGTVPAPSSFLDPNRGFARVLSAIRDPKTEAREQVHGVEAIRITGTVPRDAAAGLLPGVTSDAKFIVWFATGGRHQPVGNALTLTGASGTPVTVDMTLTNPNKKMQIPTAG